MAITSLFGPTPEQIQQARTIQQRQMLAEEAKPFGVFAPLYQAARGLQQTGINSLVSGLFPEAADPALKQAQAVQLVQQKYQGQNLSDPTVLKSIASDLFSAGAPDAGLRILKTAQELTPKPIDPVTVAADASLIDPTTGRVIYKGPGKDTIVKTNEATARAAGELGFGVRPNLSDYSEQELRAINNLIQNRGERVQAAGVPKTQPKEINKNKADLSLALEKQAIDADTQLTNATTINSVLDRAFTGVASGAVLKVGQIADALGVTVSGTTESEQLNQLLAKLAQGQAKSLPGPLSEKELTFLREAIGTSGATKETLRNVVKRIQQDAYTTIIANNKLQSYQSEGKDLNKFDFAKNTREARRLANLLEKATPEQRKQILGY